MLFDAVVVLGDSAAVLAVDTQRAAGEAVVIRSNVRHFELVTKAEPAAVSAVNERLKRLDSALDGIGNLTLRVMRR